MPHEVLLVFKFGRNLVQKQQLGLMDELIRFEGQSLCFMNTKSQCWQRPIRLEDDLMLVVKGHCNTFNEHVISGVPEVNFFTFGKHLLLKNKEMRGQKERSLRLFIMQTQYLKNILSQPVLGVLQHP